MNYKRLFWGVILITIGALFVLKNTGLIYFNWLMLLRMWPLLLVLWGISLIPVKLYIKLILSIAAIVLSVVLVSHAYRTDQYRFRWFERPLWEFHDRHSQRSDRDDIEESEDEYDQYEWESQNMYESYDSTLKYAELKLDAAAGTFKLNGTTDELIEFDKQGYFGNYSMTTEDIGSKRIINLSLKKGKINTRKDRGDKVYIKLNDKPIWNFDLDIGAASIDMDFTGFSMKKINIDGGASSVKLKLGDLYHNTKVNIDAGASSIVIRLPENSACEIETTTVLSSKSFKGFEKIDRGLYRTSNFDTADNKVYINLDAAISSFTVFRY